MQRIFPEGFVFTNALYGLSWCEVGISAPTEAIKARAIQEALFAYKQVSSENARSAFTPDLQPGYGIFYAGWKNYLLSKLLMLDTNFTGADGFIKMFAAQCESIISALKESQSPFLPSYDNAAWPADMCVAMASISNHDKVFPPKYQDRIKDWNYRVRLRLDPVTNMIPHSVQAVTGATTEGARGSSSSLILRFLAEIDSTFAMEQYPLYEQYFVSTTFGLPSINEYPAGQSGKGDIDSGPVIFGAGFAGTIVSIGTLAALGKPEMSQHQYQAVHAFGMSYNTSRTKRYIYGQLPIADAFIAWSRSSALNYPPTRMEENKNWRINFHLFSLLALSLVWLPFFWLVKR